MLCAQTQSEKKPTLDIDDLRRLIFLDNGYFTEARHLVQFSFRVDADGELHPISTVEHSPSNPHGSFRPPFDLRRQVSLESFSGA